jgi:MoxR-like ATPase
MKTRSDHRVKLYSSLGEVGGRLHFAPLEEGPGGRLMHKNIVLMTLSYILDKNHLLVGEPGWGKTTGAKILSAKLSGLPYDLYDAMEVRGNPQKYEEKIVGRPHYGKLSAGEESVVWQGTFGLDALIVDEANRLPYDSQDVILQGIDTGRWNYQNQSLFEGKKPTFLTMNERTGNHQNGLLPALKDRLDMVTEEGYFSTMVIFDFEEARRHVTEVLCNPQFAQAAIDALSRGYPEYKKALQQKPLKSYMTPEEKKAIQDEVRGLGLDNDAMLFLQAFMAEVNHSNQYGSKRASDPASQDTHDRLYAGVSVSHSFSPRSAMAALDYARALAWFMRDGTAGLDHVRFVLPHVFAHKAEFTDDYKNQHGNVPRKENQMLSLARTLVGEVHTRYVQCIQPMKNFISRMQKGEISGDELAASSVRMSDGQRVSLKPEDHDHPLMKDLVREAADGERTAFYEEG